MKIVVTIVSTIYTLIALWVIIFELPKLTQLHQYFNSNVPIAALYLYPFGFLVFGILGWLGVFNKLPKLKLGHIFLIQLSFPVLLFIFGRFFIN